MTSFNASELDRYARHLVLPEIGMLGQQRLKESRILCVGAGGLGCSALFYLAAAGIGKIGIIDADHVDVSNLQRQILYTVHDVGQAKVDIAKQRLFALNPSLDIQTYPVRLTAENALDIIRDYDVVLDATDNYTARYLINDACFHLQKPDVFACILRFAGQCSVFAMPEGPCYRCLFPTPPPPEYIPNCAQAGVLGALPGLLGSLQAIEALKILLKVGTPLIGRILTIDTLQMQWQELALLRNSECPLCAKKETFHMLQTPIPEISAEEFKKMQQEQTDFFLLDVRNPYEYEERNLGGYLIPLNELPQRLDELKREDLIVVHCQMGGRSSKAVEFLKKNGFERVYNLKGGLQGFLS